MIRTSHLLFAVLFFICLACNNKNLSDSVQKNKETEVDKIAVFDEKIEDEKFQNADTSIFSGSDIPPQTKQSEQVTRKPVDWDKKIIKTGHLNVEVKDYKTFSRSVNEKIKKYGGYISNEEQSQSEYKIENAVVIKVPVMEFENVMSDLHIDVEKTTVKRISSEDVTTALIDGKSRLEAKRQVRIRYMDLLKQAKNMEEIIKVQSEINAIQEEIEMVAGRINILSNTSAMSTIHFHYAQILDPQALTKEPKPETFINKLKAAFSVGWYWIGEIIITLIGIWPILLLIAFAIYYFKRKPTVKLKST